MRVKNPAMMIFEELTVAVIALEPPMIYFALPRCGPVVVCAATRAEPWALLELVELVAASSTGYGVLTCSACRWRGPCGR